MALKMVQFDFASGLRPDQNGKPNGNGVELIESGSSGSGFLVSDDGTIVTNYHVARKTVKGEALFQEGSRFEIRNIKVYDRPNDIAILKISGQKAFPACTLGDSNTAEPRDKVLAVGNPLGMGLNITEGSISQVVRNDLKEAERINHTATITSGNSGGALYRGNEVMGINAAVMVNPAYGGSTGFFYAIPINKAKRLLEDPQYNRLLRLEQIFPPNVEAIASKAKQLDGKTGQIPAGKQKGNTVEPGAWKIGFQTLALSDYGFVVESASNNISIVLLDSNDKLKGFGKKKQNQYLPLFLNSSYPEQYTVVVLNFDTKPVNFGLKTYQIAW
ncbi:MAG: S1C family serine protease [Syntrophobacteraceae bacterium]